MTGLILEITDPGTGLLRGNDLQIAFSPEDGNAHIVRVSCQEQIDARASDGQIQNAQPFDLFWQNRMCKHYASCHGIDLQTEAGLH